MGDSHHLQLRAFLSAKRGKQLDAATFPDAVLNGIQLDLWALYREVAVRGGFECLPSPLRFTQSMSLT